MNLKKIIGGNGNLSPNGQQYGIALGDYIRSTIDPNNTRFITSTLNRTLQTAKLAQVDIFDKVSFWQKIEDKTEFSKKYTLVRRN